MTDQTPPQSDAIHNRFGLTYANYLVLPRTLLQSMPDTWQTAFCQALDQFDEAFQHVPQADGYKVDAATEYEVFDLDEQQRAQLGITEDWYRGETPPVGLSEADLNDWKDQHENPDGPVYHRDGQEISGGDLVMLPAVDPVPHYDRGRTYIQPAAVRGAARQAAGQPAADEAPQYGVDGCTCRPWTNRGDGARWCTAEDTVDMVAGWDPGPGCPRHPAAGLAAPTNHNTEARAAVLREAADFIDKLQAQMDEEIRAEYSELDRDTEVEGAATRRMATELRRLAAGAES